MKKQINWMLLGVSLLVALCWAGPVAAQVSLELLNPRGEIKPPPTFAPTPRVADLAGKKIGIYWNGKSGGTTSDVAEELLKEISHRNDLAVQVLRSRRKTAGIVAKEVDIFIYGVGD
jgi:hypothetical protein